MQKNRKGWFAIPGVQDGDRTLAEQLKGLDPLLVEVSGKTVLDLGCAEGLIAQACVARGAAFVNGLDNNPAFIERARALSLPEDKARFDLIDMNTVNPVYTLPAADLVLGLAIFHKLADPAYALRQWSTRARDLLVIRLPHHGANGVIASKHRPDQRADINAVMPGCGFFLDGTLPGPRGEPVQYWRRNPT